MNMRPGDLCVTEREWCTYMIGMIRAQRQEWLREAEKHRNANDKPRAARCIEYARERNHSVLWYRRYLKRCRGDV